MAAAAPPRVFCTMGHGCDLVDEDRKIVPDGCKYITSEICGMSSIDLPKIFFAFGDSLLRDALQHPDHPGIWSVLNEYFKLPAGSPLRVRNAGDSYTDSIITLWGNAGWAYFKSGIYQLGSVPEGGIYNPGSPGVMAKLHPREVNDELRQFIYRGSTWLPTPDGSLEKRYSEIMRDQPGIYYHLACRSACNSNLPNVERHVELKRQQSVNQIRRKGELHQLGPFGQNARPSIRTEKRTFMNRYNEWEHYVKDKSLRDGWQRRINIALAEIASSVGSAESSSAAAGPAAPTYASSAVVSNNNALPDYINVPPSASSSAIAAQESNSNEESNEESNSNRDSNEESRNEKNARRQQRIHNRTIRALFRASRANGGRRTRKSYRKKANRQTRKRSTRKYHMINI